MSKVKSVSCGVLAAEGETVAEARETLAVMVEDALSGDYRPFFVAYGNYTAVVYREPTGWHYRLLANGVQPGVSRLGFGTFYETREKAIVAAAFHVLDLGSGDEEFHSDDDIPNWLTERRERDVLLHNARFRRAYRWVKANQPDGRDNDHLWHEWAGWHSHDSQFA